MLKRQLNLSPGLAKIAPYLPCHRDSLSAKVPGLVAGWLRQVTLTAHTRWPLAGIKNILLARQFTDKIMLTPANVIKSNCKIHSKRHGINFVARCLRFNKTMNKLIPITLILFLTYISCEREPDRIPFGTYVGTFQRQNAFGGGEISNVMITFSMYSWTGESDKSKYPALGDGSYSLYKDKVTFNNASVWTAEFDWSLILSGDYKIFINNDQIKISREYSGPSTDTWTDIYLLTKQNK